MKCGVFSGISFEEYQAIPAINNGGLGEFKKSPLHYWSRALDPEKEERVDTPALVLGRAIHHAVLEPELFENQYRIKPEPEDFPGYLATLDHYKQACRDLALPVGGTKPELKTRLKASRDGLRFFDDLLATYATYNLLTKKEMKTCRSIASKVRGSEACKELLKDGKAEQTLIWTDPVTKVYCKARADFLTNDYQIIVDLKSTEDAGKQGFQRSIETYGYYRQAAWYSMGLHHLKRSQPLFIFVAFEKLAPYASGFYYASNAMLEEGSTEIRQLLSSYEKCLAENNWPGYPAELVEINRPAWAKKLETTQAEAY
jgi:hypothetical protein